MTSGLSSIALFAPAAASSAVFSFRRASRGADAIDEKPIYGMMNIDLAAGQALKAANATADMVKVSDPLAGKELSSAANAIKNIAKESKFLNGVGKVVKFTADNVNPIICVVSGVNVLSSDDKVDALARESLALTTMFAAEGAAKRILGMPQIKKIEGKRVTIPREGLYRKNLFITKQAESLKEFCETKKLCSKVSLKALPGIAKGLAFVLASCLGYQAGVSIGNAIIGEKQSA